MDRPICLVDMDGVIVDLLPEWLDQYHLVGGERLTAEDITAYNWENQVKDKELFRKVLDSAGLFHTAKPLMGAVEGFKELCQVADTYIVTKVMPGNSRAFDAKGGWLWRYFPGFSRDRVIFAAAKHLVRGDYLVEDAPQNISTWLKAWPKGHAFIVDQPYNRDFVHRRCTRVESLLDVSFLLRGER